MPRASKPQRRITRKYAGYDIKGRQERNDFNKGAASSRRGSLRDAIPTGTARMKLNAARDARERAANKRIYMSGGVGGAGLKVKNYRAAKRRKGL
jgi:hypothetical protein